MKESLTWIIGASLLVALPALADNPKPKPTDLEFEELEILYESNASDGDAEVVIVGKAPEDEAMRWVRVVGPDTANPERIMGMGTNGNESLGMGQFKFESAEPDIEQVRARYPDGTYIAYGRTISNKRVYGEIEFDKELPDAPVVDTCDQKVDPAQPVIYWSEGEEIDAVLVEVENEDLGVGFETTLPGDASSLNLPAGFLVEGSEYDLGVGFFNERGNLVVTECSFEAS